MIAFDPAMLIYAKFGVILELLLACSFGGTWGTSRRSLPEQLLSVLWRVHFQTDKLRGQSVILGLLQVYLR